MTLVNGKVALVTGASSGIGEATALKLQSLGYTVYGAARRVERMAGLADRGIYTLAMDVTDEASMQAGVEQIIAAEGRIDVLVNSAGYASFGAIEDVPIAEARRQFEVNLFGVARLSQLVLPAMRAARSGMIVNISSMSGRIWTPIGSWLRWRYPLGPFVTWHLPTALASARLLRALNPTRLAVGHGPVLEAPGAAMDEAIRTAERQLARKSKGLFVENSAI